MNEDLYRIDMSRVFQFVGTYKYTLILLPLVLAATVFLSTLVIEPVYRFSARFVPCHITHTTDGRRTFLKSPNVIISEIKAGLYRNLPDQELESTASVGIIDARLIRERSIEISLESGKGTKGEEILRAMLTEIMNDQKEYAAIYTPLNQQTQEELDLLRKYEDELETLRAAFQARTGLNAEAINLNAPAGIPAKDLALLSEVYMQLVRIGIQLQAMELRVSRLANQLPTLMRVHEMEIVQPPKRTPQPVYPQTGLWVIVALSLGLVGAVLLALLIDSYSKYRAERSNA